jgi:adenylate kinase
MPSRGIRGGWQTGDTVTCHNPAPMPLRARRLVFLGPPGVGKGTQGQRLGPDVGACHLSTGDLFRSAALPGGLTPSPAMQVAIDAIARGEYASDALAIDLVRERFQCVRCVHGFLLDGFPRTVPQAEVLEGWLHDAGLTLDAAINLLAPDAIIVDRLSGRRVCRDCRRSCHATHDAPCVAGTCDACGGALFQRDDDRPDAIAVRLQTYARTAAPLLDFYRHRGLLVDVDGTGTPAEVYARLRRAIGTPFATMADMRGN